MIDQSNRAGKSCINDKESSSLSSSPIIKKRSKHLTKKSRDSSLNDRKLSRRTNPVKIPVVSQQLSPSYITKGKSV
jgi:hypothetical protein